MINLNDTTPSAPVGSSNVKWQTDVSGNVSAYYSRVPTKTIITPASGIITIDASLGNSFFINVNQALTSITITNPTDGQELLLMWAQDATGHAVTLPANLIGATAISITASKHTLQKFSYNAADTSWYAIDAGMAGI